MWINKDIYTKQKAHKSTTVHMTSHLTHYYIFFFFPKLDLQQRGATTVTHTVQQSSFIQDRVQIKCSSSKYWTSAAFLLFTCSSVKLFTVYRTSHQIHEAVLCHYHRSYLSKLSLNSYCEKNTSNIVSFHWTAEKRKGKKGMIKVKLESFQHFLLG